VTAHPGLNIVEQRSTEEKSGALAANILTAIHRDSCSFSSGGIYIRRDAFAMLRRNQRTHLVAVLETGSDFDTNDALTNHIDQRIGYLADGHNDGDGHAALTS